MSQKVILVSIRHRRCLRGGLALFDPNLEVLGLAARRQCGAEQATKNVHILVEQLDPPAGRAWGLRLPSSST